MSELIDYLKDKYTKNSEKAQMRDKMNIQRVTNTIAFICEMYLKEAGQVLKFEVAQKDLSYAIQAIEDDSLTTMYNIIQVSETLFDASLQELQI